VKSENRLRQHNISALIICKANTGILYMSLKREGLHNAQTCVVRYKFTIVTELFTMFQPTSISVADRGLLYYGTIYCTLLVQASLITLLFNVICQYYRYWSIQTNGMFARASVRPSCIAIKQQWVRHLHTNTVQRYRSSGLSTPYGLAARTKFPRNILSPSSTLNIERHKKPRRHMMIPPSHDNCMHGLTHDGTFG
jgi:hypothetical protein